MEKHNRLYIVSELLFLILIAATYTNAANIEPTPGSMISIQNPQNLSAGLRLQRDRREFQTDTELLEFDINHVLFRMGGTPLPFLSLWVEGGISQAERIDDKGSSGFQWGLGVHAKALEYVIESSPVFGIQKAVALEIDITYSQYESNFSDKDLSCNELTISPLLSYTSNSSEKHTWFSHDPAGVAIRGGPVFISTDGDYGEGTLKEHNNFGGRIIFDFLLGSGWVARLDGTFIGNDERQLAFGVNRYF